MQDMGGGGHSHSMQDMGGIVTACRISLKKTSVGLESATRQLW